MFTLDNFYKSKQWEKLREIYIADHTDDNGYIYCAMCGKPILKKYDLILDHITELTEDNVNDYSISLNPDNLRPLHFICHNKRHERYGFGTGGYIRKPKRVYIVYGAPCSGKSSWVKSVANDNDLIVDIDNIYEMISNNDRYVKNDAIKSVVFAVRDCLYDTIRYRSGRWQNAYIITGGARSGDRARLKQRISADELIFIDTPKDECLKRADERSNDNWIDYINDWFEAYQPEYTDNSNGGIG